MWNPFAGLLKGKPQNQVLYDAVVTEVSDEPGGLTRVRLEYLPERGNEDGFVYGRRELLVGRASRVMEAFLPSDIGRRVCPGDRMSAQFTWRTPE